MTKTTNLTSEQNFSIESAKAQWQEIEHFQALADKSKIYLDSVLRKKLLAIQQPATKISTLEAHEALLDQINATLIKQKISLNTTTLDISAMGLTRFPEQLFIEPAYKNYWATLEVLRCSNNQLKSLPRDLFKCVMLRELHCNDNQLETLFDLIGQCLRLQVLDCRGNHLRSIPEALNQCEVLYAVNCNQNYLVYFPPSLVFRFGNTWTRRMLNEQRKEFNPVKLINEKINEDKNESGCFYLWGITSLAANVSTSSAPKVPLNLNSKKNCPK